LTPGSGIGKNQEPEMDSVEKEEALDDTNRYRYHTVPLDVAIIKTQTAVAVK
jgi:hypothetical protein